MRVNGEPLSPDKVRNIEGLLDEWLVDESVPGVSVTVVDGEGVRYANGLGARDLESVSPATPQTLYGVGSIAKAVTGIAVLQLVERDDVALTDQIDQYVPVLTDVPGEPITVGELLSHSSGMPQDFVASRDNIADREDLFRHIDGAADQRLTDEGRYMYYNSGFFVLGELVEAVDGRPYPEYVEQEIFAPLGMERSTFDPEDLETDDDAMTGYASDGDDLRPEKLDGGAGASGGLISSVTELGTLLRCVMNDGQRGDQQILAPELVEAMCRSQAPSMQTDDGASSGYGYGWEVSDFLDDTLVAHRGGIFVSGGYVGLLRERGIGVALAFNTTGQPVVSISKGVLAIVCGENPEEVVRALAARAKAATAAGTYGGYRDAITAVVKESVLGTITVSIDERDLEFTLSPDSSDREKYTYSTIMGNGHRWTAEFRETDTGMQMLLSMGKWTAVLSKQ